MLGRKLYVKYTELQSFAGRKLDVKGIEERDGIRELAATCIEWGVVDSLILLYMYKA